MSNVVLFPGITKLDLPPGQILAKAAEVEFESVVVLGCTKDGQEYFCSSLADGGNVLWLLERAKHRLMRIVDEASP